MGRGCGKCGSPPLVPCKVIFHGVKSFIHHLLLPTFGFNLRDSIIEIFLSVVKINRIRTDSKRQSLRSAYFGISLTTATHLALIVKIKGFCEQISYIIILTCRSIFRCFIAHCEVDPISCLGIIKTHGLVENVAVLALIKLRGCRLSYLLRVYLLGLVLVVDHLFPELVSRYVLPG